MTKQRDLKKLVRERMKRTGERYATARAHIVQARSHDDPQPTGVHPGYGPCGGLQTETGALTNVLRHAGVRDRDGKPLDETTVFGLCGGIGFLYGVFEYKGHPPTMTVVARQSSMPDVFVAAGIERIVPGAETIETSAPAKARRELDRLLDAGQSVLCTVDAAALPYYGLPANLVGMGPQVVAAIGRDGNDHVWLDDRGTAPIRLSNEAFAAARAGYRKGKHRMTVIPEAIEVDRKQLMLDALRAAVDDYDTPPAKPFASNVGTPGLRKWARLLADEKDAKGWRKVFAEAEHAYVGLHRAYDCTQHEYTAPAGSRPLFAAFLDEAAATTGLPGLTDIAGEFRRIGEVWEKLGRTIADCGDSAVERGCGLSDRRAELLDEQGADATEEMATLWAERRDLAASCKLAPAGAAAIYAELAPMVSEIAESERSALDRLGQLLPE
ncbi:hypothetical protein ABI59_14870 [Acidobacteria bacterium Mor1]|nr:hypothetical protein ABI59_14870 [Acidobacteria bacterium Mor1]